jgi:hypothetical protein
MKGALSMKIILIMPDFIFLAYQGIFM